MPRTQEVPSLRRAPPNVHRLDVREANLVYPDGTVELGLHVGFVPPTYYDVAGYDVWWQDSTAATGDWQYGGRFRRSPAIVRSALMLPGRTYRVAVVPVSALGASAGPDGVPASSQATVTFTGEGPAPADVTGFAAAAERGFVLFSWTALNRDENPDVVGYEIRAGATGWLSASVVGVYSPVGRPFAIAPRSRATGTSFYIRAVTTTGVTSVSSGTATLSAADANELDTVSSIGYQEVTVLAGAQTVTVTTRATYTSAPFVTATCSDGGLVCYTDTYAANPDNTYSYTLRISDIAETGGVTVHIHEAGAGG